MSHNSRRGIKDGSSDYQWMRSPRQETPQQFSSSHSHSHSHSSHQRPLYSHTYYAPAQPSLFSFQRQHEHNNGSWNRNPSFASNHGISQSDPQQYLDMFSAPPPPVDGHDPYGYNSYQHEEQSDPFWTEGHKDHLHHQEYNKYSHENGVESLESGMNALTVDTSVSDRALFSHDLLVFKKNQEITANQSGSTWASVAAGKQSKAALIKAKMLASSGRQASYANSVETSPNSSSWCESSKNGSSSKTPPTTPSSSSGSIPFPYNSSSHSLSVTSSSSSSSMPPSFHSQGIDVRAWNNLRKVVENSYQKQNNPPMNPRPQVNDANDILNGRRFGPQELNVSWRQRNDGQLERSKIQPKEDFLKPNRMSYDSERKVDKIPERPVEAAITSRSRTFSNRINYESDKNSSATSDSTGPSFLKPVTDPSVMMMDKKHLEHNYNPKEFDLNPKNSRFFVIKSYSEDDIHRSIKYSIWSSTEHGNKRLDTAFKSQEGKGPVYLFYSVNGSGHFCGMAEMVSPIDYNVNMWGQDKRKGQFKVKWIYVKDVPNIQLRHIILENNEGRPVTHSRDTQEVFVEEGKQVLSIIHSFKHTTSLFDPIQKDFSGKWDRRSESQAVEMDYKPRDPPPRDSRDDFRRNTNSDRGFYDGGGGGRRPMFNNLRPNYPSSNNSLSRDNRDRYRPSNNHNPRHNADSLSWRQ